MAKEEGAKKKPKLQTAKKREIQNEKKRLANRSFKSEVRTAIRRFEEATGKKDAALMEKQLNAVYALMDKGVKNGVFKLNKASRVKSRLAAKAAANK